MLEENKKDNIEETTDATKDTPVEEASTEDTPVEEASTEDTPVEEASTKDTPVEEALTKDIPENDDNDDSLKFPFIIGTKLGMTQIFSSTGIAYPVTVIQAGPCSITQVKTIKSDGYNSIQLGFIDKKESKTNKPLLGHFKKNKINPKKHLKEFRINEVNDEYKLGAEISVKQFDIGDMLKITGISKGKGFAGHMKRHNFSGGRASHGKNSVMRKAGSIGAGTSPGKVWKGTRMAGRMGNNNVTIKNAELLRISSNENLFFVSGSIPGSNNNIVYITKN